jgi:hypothetical protein
VAGEEKGKGRKRRGVECWSTGIGKFGGWGTRRAWLARVPWYFADNYSKSVIYIHDNVYSAGRGIGTCEGERNVLIVQVTSAEDIEMQSSFDRNKKRRWYHSRNATHTRPS